MSVIIIGTLALDCIETEAEARSDVLGGSAAYAGLAASLFGRVGVVSIVGADFPQTHQKFLEARGIDITGVKKSSGRTFRWSGRYEGDMGQAITKKTELNVLTEFNPQVPASLQASRIVFCANIDPELQMKAIVQCAPEHIIVDSMNYWIANKKDALRQVFQAADAVILNDQEVRMYTGQPNLIKAAKIMVADGPKRVIIKKGAHGAMLYDGKEFFMCPAYPLNELIDPTGAGDSFAGAVSGYLSQCSVIDSEAYRAAVVVGTAMASFTVAGFGVDHLKTVTKDLLDTRIQELYALTRMPKSIIK